MPAYTSINWRKPKRRAERHFSLNEVLVALAVVVLLGTLVARAGIRSINAAHNASCIHYLSQYARATSLYLEDNGDFLPHEDFGSTGNYPQGTCWADVLGLAPHHMGGRDDDGFTLKMNSRLEDYLGNKAMASGPFRSMASVPSPAQTPFLFEGRTDSIYHNKTYGMHTTVQAYHSGEVNFLFLDGHVEGVWGRPGDNGGWETTNGLWWDPDVALNQQIDD